MMQQERRQPENIEFPGHDDNKTGHDLPDSDGQVSDEDISDIDGFSRPDRKPAGQDHSTENHEEQSPEKGVGDIQRESDTLSDVARTEP